MPLKSLAEIRGQSNDDSPSSGGGLKSLQDIRFGQQQQSLKQSYPQMVQDDQDLQHANENAQYADAMKSAYQSNPDAFTNPTGAPQQSFADQAQGFNAPDANGNLRTDFPGGFLNPLNDLNRLSNSPIQRTFNHSAGQAMGVPDNMMDPAVSTGNNLVDRGVGFLGGAAGYLTNPAQIEQNVGQTFFNNQPLQNLGSKVGGAIENKLPNNVATRALANTAEQGTVGALGSAAYAPFQTLNQGGDVQDIPQNVLEQGLTGGVLGGAGGALGSLGKSGLNAIANKYAGTKIGDVLGKYFGNGDAVVEPQQQDMLALPQGRGEARMNAAMDRSNLASNDTPIAGQGDIHTFALPESPQYNEIQRIKSQQTLGLPEAQPQTLADYNRRNGNVLPTNNEPIYGKGDIYHHEPLGLPQGNVVPPTRYKVLNGEESFNRIAEKVFPAATERMTPPFENPNELAKWVQGHLNDAGHDVSLNEVRQLSYEDMRQLAEEIRGRLNPADVVRKTAHDMGYGKIYDQTSPTIKDRMASDLQKQVYGVYPNKVNINKPKFNSQVFGDAEAPRQRTYAPNKPQKPILEKDPTNSPEYKMQRAQQQIDMTSNLQRIHQLEQPIIGRSAAPETKIAFNPKAKSERLQSMSEIKNTPPEAERLKPLSEIKTPKEETLNSDVQPKQRVRDKVVNYMDKQAAAAQKRIASRRNVGFVAPKGNDAVDYAIIGAAHIVRNGVKYADFSEMMLNHYGNQIKPYIPGIYKSSVELAKKNGKMTTKDIRRSYNYDQFNKNNLDSTIPDTRGQIVSKTKKEPVNLSKSIDNAYIKNVDNLHSINLLGKEAEKLTGNKISPEDSPHTLALNTRSNDMVAHQIVNKHLVDPQGNVIGPSLKDITKQIPKKQYSEFTDYLVNQHAVDRMNRGEKVFDDSLKMSPEKSAEIVRRYDAKYPEFKKIANQYHDFMDKFGQSWLVDTGRIPQEVWDAYRKESPNYVPNFREMSDLEKRNNFGGGKQSFSGQGSGVQEAKGSGRKIIDPIESTLDLISKNVKSAKKNEVMQAVGRVLEKDPEGLKGFAENVKEPEGFKPPTKQEMLKKLNEEGLEGFLKHEDDSYTTATAKPDLTKGNVVPYMKDGVPQHIKVNDIHLLDAISNMDPKSQGLVIEGLGKMTKTMKTLTTGINPLFSFTRNIFRDIPDSFNFSKTTNNPVTFAFDLVHSAISSFSNGKLAQDYKNMGGGHAGNISASRNLLKQSKTNILPHEGFMGNLKYAAQKSWHNFENFNSALETAPRLAEYKRTVQQGGGTYASKVQGIANANDVTVNFNRHGAVSKEIDKIFPYYNAAIQGLDKMVRSYNFAKNPAMATKVTMKSIASITLPTLALYYINHNDPNYQKLSSYTKDNYFLFPKGDGTFIKVPKPREAGFMFGTMVEQSLAKWSDHDPTAFKNFGDYIKNVFAPPGISGLIDTQNKSIDPLGPARDTVLGPLVNLLANKDFMDRPIVPKSLQGLSPQNQSNQNTSEIGKALAKLPLNNLSPMQIDYLIKSYGGGVAQLGLPLATKGKSVGKTLTQQVTADPTYSNDISQDFYNAKTKYDQQKADAKAQGKVSNTVGTDSYLDKMATVVSQIQKQIKVVQNNPNMADDVKQNQINALQLKMNNMQTQALNQIKKATR